MREKTQFGREASIEAMKIGCQQNEGGEEVLSNNTYEGEREKGNGKWSNWEGKEADGLGEKGEDDGNSSGESVMREGEAVNGLKPKGMQLRWGADLGFLFDEASKKRLRLVWAFKGNICINSYIF